jgi:hypothetical protein
VGSAPSAPVAHGERIRQGHGGWGSLRWLANGEVDQVVEPVGGEAVPAVGCCLQRILQLRTRRGEHEA